MKKQFDFYSLDINELVECADGFSDNDEALEYIEDRISKLRFLDNNLTLYRVLFLTSIDELNVKELGNHWTDDVSVLEDKHFLDYLKNECNGEEIPGEPFIIRAEFHKSSINFETTLRQNVINPHEEEYFLQDPRPIAPISIRKPLESVFVRPSMFDNSDLLSTASL